MKNKMLIKLLKSYGLPTYKIYEDGEDRCAELINGKFRVLERTGILFRSNTYNQKPDRFQQYRMMRLDEIDEEGLFGLIRDTIRAEFTMDGAKNLKEAAQKLRDYANELEKLKSEGWELEDHEVEDDMGNIVIALKPKDDD